MIDNNNKKKEIKKESTVWFNNFFKTYIRFFFSKKSFISGTF